jgi:hypothetical protein
MWWKDCNTTSLSLANFVGSVVGFLNVCTIRLVASSLPQLKLDNSACQFQYTSLLKLELHCRRVIVETPIPKAKRGGIGKLNNPAKRRVLPVIL